MFKGPVYKAVIDRVEKLIADAEEAYRKDKQDLEAEMEKRLAELLVKHVEGILK